MFQGIVAETDFISPVTDRWVRLTAAPGSNGVVMSFVDIHDLKFAEYADHQFKLLVTAGSNIVYRMSADWTRMYHLKGKNMLVDTEKVTGNWMDKYIPETDQLLVRACIAQAIESKSIFELEHQVIQADGSLGWIYSRAVPVFDSQDQITEWLGAVSDITMRKKGEHALRESQKSFKISAAKYLSLFNSIDQGFCVIKVLFDGNQKATDYQFLEINPAFEAQTGLKDIIGKYMRELAPDHEEHWFRNYGKVALDGMPIRFEAEAVALKRWFDVYAFAIDEPEKHHVAILFNDITARKEIEDKQTFLLKLSDALHPLADPKKTVSVAMQLLAVHLGLSRAQYYEIESKDEYLTSRGGYTDGKSLISKSLQVNEFGVDAKKTFLAGQTMSVRGIESLVGVPVVKDGRLVAVLGLYHKVSHDWSAHEIALAEETAQRTWAAFERAKIEEVLRKTELRLYTVLQQAPIAIAISGSSGEILFRNRVFDELWGRPAHETTARLYSDFYQGFHLDGKAIVSEDWPGSRAVLEGKVIDGEVLEIVRQNGEHIFCAFNAAPIRDEQGSITGGVVLFRDVSVERSVEAALRASEEKYRNELKKEVADRTRELQENYALLQTIYDTNLVGMSVFAPVRDNLEEIVDFQILMVNKLIVSATGRDDMVGKLYAELFPGVKQMGLFDLMVKTFKTGEHGKMEYHYAYDGIDRWYSTMFVKGEDILVSTNLDITERVKAEEERFRNYLLLQQSEDLAQAGSWDFDLLSGALSWSDGMYRLFNLQRGVEVRPEVYLDFATPECLPAAQRIVDHLRNGDRDFEETLEIQVNENATVLHIKANAVKNENGDSVRVLGVNMDITATRETERRLRLLEARQQQEIFQVTLNTQEQERRRVSESLHNGLGQLLYGTKLSLNYLTPETAIENTEKYIQAKHYTQDLLAEAIKETRRISHELMPTVLAEFGLKAAIKEVCSQLQSGVRFNCTVSLGDFKLDNYLELAVFRTVQELMINVVRHANASQATVIVNAKDNEVRVYVKDNGRGMAIKADGKQGIGLSSIRNKVELLKGTISIKGKSTSGTVVDVCFPIYNSNQIKKETHGEDITSRR
ncbi:hypothetical protein BFS30_22280 [Pedobacter steynii]|uniref:Oxygen sensor histidine kinase NreB n=1 Tax=Pedobacter steynii TaxID=430522 RepID=A0A1D7QM10_9SPHI|nr:hypothetical protein BFS30_22280 [Pedobacter steynii]